MPHDELFGNVLGRFRRFHCIVLGTVAVPKNDTLGVPINFYMMHNAVNFLLQRRLFGGVRFRFGGSFCGSRVCVYLLIYLAVLYIYSVGII